MPAPRLLPLPNGAPAFGFTTAWTAAPFANVTTTLPPFATAMRGLLEAVAKPPSARSGSVQAPFTSRDTHTCGTAPTFFRYAIAVVPSGATSDCTTLFAAMSALGPSTVAPGTIAAWAAAGTARSIAVRLARARRLMAYTLSGAERFVQRRVDQLVGSLVVLAAHGAHRP